MIDQAHHDISSTTGPGHHQGGLGSTGVGHHQGAFSGQEDHYNKTSVPAASGPGGFAGRSQQPPINTGHGPTGQYGTVRRHFSIHFEQVLMTT